MSTTADQESRPPAAAARPPVPAAGPGARPPRRGPGEDPSFRPAREENRRWTERHLGGTPVLDAAYLTQRFARHSHERFEIGIDEVGSHRVWYRGASHLVPPLRLVVICPGEVHDGRRAGAGTWRYRAIFPDRGMLQALGGEPLAGAAAGGGALTFGRLVHSDPSLGEWFLRAHQRLTAATATAAAEGGMLRFLAALVLRHGRWRDPAAASGRERPEVVRARSFIDERLGDALTLEEIARAAGLSRFHFLRVFRREVGLTPHEYLVQRRIDGARLLLRRGESLAGAAYLLGFADQSHFTQQFKRLVGVTPGEFARGCATSPEIRAGGGSSSLDD